MFKSAFISSVSHSMSKCECAPAKGDYAWHRCFEGAHYVQLRKNCSLRGTHLSVQEKETSPSSLPKICLLSWIRQLGSCPFPHWHLKYPQGEGSPSNFKFWHNPGSQEATAHPRAQNMFSFMRSSPNVRSAVSPSTACPLPLLPLSHPNAWFNFSFWYLFILMIKIAISWNCKSIF